MTLLERLNYYVDRLVLQFRDRPKAQATIRILVKQAIADDLLFQVLDAYDIDTSVGDQLDVVGKYVGVPRAIGAPPPQGFFGFWDYASARDPALYQGTWDPATDVPAIPAAGGGNAGWWYVAWENGAASTPITESFLAGNVIYSDGTQWIKEIDDNGSGLNTYSDLSVNQNSFIYRYGYSVGLDTNLSDESYRAVIKLQAILNHNDGTLAAIDADLQKFFPGLIKVVDNKDMTLTYFVDSRVALTQELLTVYLPRPMGVGITVFIVSPPPSGSGGEITTEDGFTITTEDGTPITTEG